MTYEVSDHAAASIRAAGSQGRPRSPRSFVSLAGLHARMQLLETVRIPVAVIGNFFFPAMALLFFVVPNAEVAQDPTLATVAVAQLALFAVMSTSLFSYGTGVAEDRALPFDAYQRTLPAAAAPRTAGRIVNGVIWTAAALVPVVLIGALLTEASLSFWRFALGFLVVLAISVPFTLMGLAIGYSLPAKAALAVVQLTLFPLAFAGGLFLPPETFPRWLDVISQGLPSRAGRDLLAQILTGEGSAALALPVLLVWTLVFAALTIWAYRRDEGRRFR